ncbi:MAG TPA: DUF4160 domain-containing protein [Tepidisphaeraceae bacterium]|jgi:hypothetical protein|nr:DUF4160 domain-containing protein [Tepidisphaeraceae bacterium]
MPTVLRIGPYRLHFYAADGHEPPHVHVARDEKELKVWLDTVRAAGETGFNAREIRAVLTLIADNREVLLRTWHDYFRH